MCRWRTARACWAFEVALALALLVGSTLLVRSLVRLQSEAPGFDPRNVLTMRLSLAPERYSTDEIEPFFQTLRERVAAIAGVTHVATASQLPPVVFSQRQFSIEGQAPPADGSLPVAYATLASPGYFEALRIPVVRGRVFTDADRPNMPFVVVINEAAARRYFAGTDPIGQRIRAGDSPPMEVVGVVGSTRNRGLDVEPAPEMFVSTVQAGGWWNQLFLLVRTQVPPRSVLPAIRQAVAAIDPVQPVYMIRTLEEGMAEVQATRRLSLASLATFSLFALILAAVGIYGVAAFAVTQRTREIGLRMALGARAGQVRRLVLRQSLLPVGLGLLGGVSGGLALGRAMSGLLYGVGGSDPLSLAAAGGFMLLTTLVATDLPARRASRLDPVRALRPD